MERGSQPRSYSRIQNYFTSVEQPWRLRSFDHLIYIDRDLSIAAALCGTGSTLSAARRAAAWRPRADITGKPALRVIREGREPDIDLFGNAAAAAKTVAT
jgi:hypothetical protein